MVSRTKGLVASSTGALGRKQMAYLINNTINSERRGMQEEDKDLDIGTNRHTVIKQNQ